MSISLPKVYLTSSTDAPKHLPARQTGGWKNVAATMWNRLPEHRECVTHDTINHGTTLFTAPDVATRQMTSQCKRRHQHREFLGFLRQIRELVLEELYMNLIVGNTCTSKHAMVRALLAQRPRFYVHHSPTQACLRNQVER